MIRNAAGENRIAFEGVKSYKLLTDSASKHFQAINQKVLLSNRNCSANRK